MQCLPPCCHYCFFFNNGFKFQNSLCNGCHNLTMPRVNFTNIVAITVKDVDYRLLFMILANLRQLI